MAYGWLLADRSNSRIPPEPRECLRMGWLVFRPVRGYIFCAGINIIPCLAGRTKSLFFPFFIMKCCFLVFWTGCLLLSCAHSLWLSVYNFHSTFEDISFHSLHLIKGELGFYNKLIQMQDEVASPRFMRRDGVGRVEGMWLDTGDPSP